MKSIIVTGASSGIGRATAEAFLDQGWHVGLLARGKERLGEIAEGRENATVLPADVTDAGQVNAAFSAFSAKIGRLDVLFNNAGIFPGGGAIDQLAVDDWYDAVNVNLNGMFLAARAAFATMRNQHPQGGRIINNGSISAHTPRPYSIAYTTTKHAITGMTKSLSLDGRDLNIACGQIDIGNARTPMVEALNQAARERGDAEQPTMSVADVANSVLHMATLPAEANVQFMTVMATTMPYVGRG